MITIKNLIKYITSGTLSRPAGAFWPNNLIKINKIGHIIHPKRKNGKTCFLNIALNRVLTLPDYFLGNCVAISLKISHFENKSNILVTKH